MDGLGAGRPRDLGNSHTRGIEFPSGFQILFHPLRKEVILMGLEFCGRIFDLVVAVIELWVLVRRATT